MKPTRKPLTASEISTRIIIITVYGLIIIGIGLLVWREIRIHEGQTPFPDWMMIDGPPTETPVPTPTSVPMPAMFEVPLEDNCPMLNPVGGWFIQDPLSGLYYCADWQIWAPNTGRFYDVEGGRYTLIYRKEDTQSYVLVVDPNGNLNKFLFAPGAYMTVELWTNTTGVEIMGPVFLMYQNFTLYIEETLVGVIRQYQQQ